MQGELSSEENMGIIPRIVKNLFDKIEQASSKIEFTVKASMVEIYNERIKVIII